MAEPSITNNSPSNGHISWDSFGLRYMGVSYDVPAGSTSEKWVWWKFNDGQNTTLQAGPNVPADLTDDDVVLFTNRNGIGVRVQSSNFVDGELLVDGSVVADALAANIISSEHIITEGLDAGVIKFGVMSGERIEAETILAEQIGAGAVIAEKLGAGAVIAEKISAEAVTAAKIAAQAITAEKIAAEAITADKLASVISLVQKRLQVGDNISIDTNDGIKIITDSGFIQFPADKSRPSVVGDIVALSATIMDSLSIRGDQNFIDGTLSAASGVMSPQQAPTLSNYWVNHPIAAGDPWETTSGFISSPDGGNVWGLTDTLNWDPANNIDSNTYSIRQLVIGQSTSTLVRTLGTSGQGEFADTEPMGVYDGGGITRLFNSTTQKMEHFLLCSNSRYSADGAQPTYKIFRYNEDFSQLLGTWLLPQLTGKAYYNDPVLGWAYDNDTNYNKRLVVIWVDNSTTTNYLRMKFFTTTGGNGGADKSVVWTINDVPRFVGQGGAGYLVGAGGKLYGFGYNLARAASEDYIQPPVSSNTYQIIGMLDAINTSGYEFIQRDYSQAGGTRMYYYSVDHYTKTLWCKYTFYDSDPGGVYGLGGETKPSPAKSFAKPRGAWMRIDTPKPPDGGDPDDPDSIRYYLSETDSNYQLQGNGPNATYLRSVGSGPAPPTVNSWDARPGNSGRFRSMPGSLINGVDTGIWDLNGDGSGKAGPLSWDSAGNVISAPSSRSCKIRATANQTPLNPNVFTKMTMGTVEWDTDANSGAPMADLANSRIYIRKAGKYRVTARGSFSGNTSGNRRIVEIAKNGAETTARVDRGDTAAGFPTMETSDEFDCVVGDYFECWEWHNATVALVSSMTSNGVPSLTVTEISGLPGPKGDVGPAWASWKGAWSAATAYAVGDVVTYNGSSYRRLVAGTTATPPSGDAANWGTLAEKGTVTNQDTGWIDITLTAPWTAYGAGWQQPQYRIFNNVVYLRGLIKGGTASGQAIATLPAAARPAVTQLLVAGIAGNQTSSTTAGGTAHTHQTANSQCRLDVQADGVVYPTFAAGSTSYLSLFGVSYPLG